MKLTLLTTMVLNLNAEIDSGAHSDITLEQARDAIRQERVIEFLHENTGMDVSMFGDGISIARGFRAEYGKQLKQILGGYAGAERKKWGVQNSGLCLLLAWTNELIQSGANVDYTRV